MNYYILSILTIIILSVPLIKTALSVHNWMCYLLKLEIAVLIVRRDKFFVYSLFVLKFYLAFKYLARETDDSSRVVCFLRLSNIRFDHVLAPILVMFTEFALRCFSSANSSSLLHFFSVQRCQRSSSNKSETVNCFLRLYTFYFNDKKNHQFSE